MAQLTTERLRKMIEEAEAEEDRSSVLERLERLEQRLEERGSGGLSDDDVAFLRRLREQQAATDDDPPAGDDPDDDPPADDDPDDDPPAAKTRPGRKSGMAYDWTVDDDGNVVESATAIVYTGEDEPDEVELPS